jgi:putative MATE family efflux protein
LLDLTKNDKISPLINKLTRDNFTGLISLLILGLVDSYFLSFYSGNDLAAATYSNPFVFTFLTLFFGASAAKTVFLSKKYKTSKDNLIYYSNYIDKYFFSIAIILISILWFSIEKIFILTNINPTILPLAVDYSKYHFIGFIFCLINICLGSFLRSKGNTKIITRTFLIISILNIILDPIFIFYFDLGAKGAAIATSLAWLFAGIYIFYMVFFKLGYTFKTKKTNLKDFTKLLPSSILNQILNPLTIMISVIFVNAYGIDILSGYGVGFRIEKILVAISLAIGSSILIFTGQNSENPIRQKEGLTYSLKLNFILISLFSVLCFVFSNHLINIFELTDAAKESANTYLKIMSLIFMFQGTQLIYSSYLSVINKHNFILGINIVKTLIVLPLALYFGGSLYGIEGLFYGLAIHHFIMLIATITFSFKEINYLFKKNNKTKGL